MLQPKFQDRDITCLEEKKFSKCCPELFEPSFSKLTQFVISTYMILLLEVSIHIVSGMVKFLKTHLMLPRGMVANLIT